MKKLNLGKPIPSSEITPEDVYLNRRKFMQAAGLAAAGTLLAACAPGSSPASETKAGQAAPDEQAAPDNQAAPAEPGNVSKQTDELGDPINTFDEITNYNNFYEFTMDKEGVAPMSKDFSTRPWTVEVSGLVGKPQTFSIDDIIKKFPSEERIYRLRCVEAWSMVIPWMGFSLSELIKAVEPTGDAKYIGFTTLQDAQRFPGQKLPGLYPWPYSEGLRMDEAMHDLTILVTGMYGKDLLPQNGAPLRLAVPWKYGFKSIKSIVKIEFLAEQPRTFWNDIAPDEYGFYANVNPEVSHPRWSQATERRIGEPRRRKTIMFNGYEEQVASLYSGMDLRENY